MHKEDKLPMILSIYYIRKHYLPQSPLDYMTFPFESMYFVCNSLLATKSCQSRRAIILRSLTNIVKITNRIQN